MSRVVSLLPPISARPGASPGSTPIALAGPLAALQAAAIGLLVVTVVVLTGWASAPLSSASAPDALRAAAQGWLLAHHTDLAVPGGRITMAPLGLLLLPGGLLLAAASRASRAAGVDGARRGALLTLTIALPYAVVAALLAIGAGGAGKGLSAWQAGAHALAFSVLTAGPAVVHEAAIADRLLRRLPVAGRSMLVGAGAGVLGMIGSGALLVAVALLWHHRRHVEVIAALSPGGVGGVLLTVFGILLLPNAALWGASYALGPGFAVGTDTAVAPGDVVLGAVPAVPLLTALPASGSASPAGYAVLVVPVLAGVLIGLTVGKNYSEDTALLLYYLSIFRP